MSVIFLNCVSDVAVAQCVNTKDAKTKDAKTKDAKTKDVRI